MTTDLTFNDVYSFETDNLKCGFCNFATTTHFVVAASEKEAREIFELDRKRGFCGTCLVQEVIDQNYRLVLERDLEE